VINSHGASRRKTIYRKRSVGASTKLLKSGYMIHVFEGKWEETKRVNARARAFFTNSVKYKQFFRILDSPMSGLTGPPLFEPLLLSVVSERIPNYDQQVVLILEHSSS